MNRTLVIIKPDSIQRNLLGSIITRIEKKGFQIIGMKMVQLNNEQISSLYEHHRDKPFFPRLQKYMTSSPVAVLALLGQNVIEEMRKLCGETDPLRAAPGTIRGDWALTKGCNLIHASDSQSAAKKELNFFFEESELISWQPAYSLWLQEDLWQ